MTSAVSSSAPITGPMMVARPPNRLTPPSTTAATELSRKEVLAAGSAAPTRATSRMRGDTRRAAPAIDVHRDLDPCGADAPVAAAASELPPVASTWVPKRVWNSTTWARTASAMAIRKL